MKKGVLFLAGIIMTLFLCSCAGLGDYDYSLGNGYNLVRFNAHGIEVLYEGDELEGDGIPEKVVEIAWDEKYIIAKQFGMKRETPDDPDRTYEIPDETKVYYWVIDKVKRKRYGPYNKDEFDKKLVKLNLTHLELKDVEDYRPAE